MEQDGKNPTAVLPEVRNNGTAVQWKYRDEPDWRDLVAFTELRVLPEKTERTAAGENGKNGTNGKDGSDGKNGINGKDGINGSTPTAKTVLTELTA